jgi:hypothetical protein
VCALFRFRADRWATLLVANALVKNLPDQPTEPMRNGSNGLGVSEARDKPTINNGDDRALALTAALAAWLSCCADGLSASQNGLTAYP